MKKSVNFVFCLHNHQPPDNFEEVFETNYKLVYSPFINLLKQFPDIKTSLHYSGSLLKWLERAHPKFLTDLKSLIESGQIEIMGGGFYDPVLPMIPDIDKLGQISLFSDYLKELFGTKPEGMWLAGRVWEQVLAKHINDAGLKYTVLDDFHFRGTGIPEKELSGYYVTEESGKMLSIFVNQEKLRYAIPFSEPEVTIEFLRQFATDAGDKTIVYADDGEKFGAWPNTYRHCYENKWLERFFKALTENKDWINFVTFSESLSRFPPVGKAYIPDATYREMAEWSLPAEPSIGYSELMDMLKTNKLYEKSTPFIRGGIWRNFAVKYPEINLMYSRMLEVSDAVNQMDKGSADYKNARDKLYRAQNNCAYWHGLFGGFYLPHLRYTVYKHLIDAETMALSKKQPQGIAQSDFDHDGFTEIKLSNADIFSYFKPNQGGALYEFDIIRNGFNPLATVARRHEAYHNKILKNMDTARHFSSSKILAAEPNGIIDGKNEGYCSNNVIACNIKDVENLIYYDIYQRMSLIDHFFGHGSTLNDIAKCHYKEEGDFISGKYSVEVHNGKNNKLVLSREGNITKGDKNCKVIIEKEISLLNKPEIGLKITYRITNKENEPIDTVFGVEFNFAMVAGDSPDRFYLDTNNNNLGNMVATGETRKQRRFGIRDFFHKMDILLEFNSEPDILYFPVQSVSQSEDGFELIYQNSVIIPRWSLNLLPNQSWQCKIIKRVITSK